ncbi:protein tipD [Dorcoceras hygrometricum]|uniref:Protein tipD n=1 Tax=Dorcoceras hygrometricum TaxID=472368 RepID=A0A2Z7CRR6_9LAMI|nr:protein tipD [Dorcoceras hygrometricum]
MGATHSSQHTAPDAKHSSTRCYPTHEMWELPTPLIVANRSQQRDEVYGSYPLVLNRHTDKMTNTEHMQRIKAYIATRIITHAQSKAAKQAHTHTSSLLSYNYHKAVPSNIDVTPAKPNTDTNSGTIAQKLRIWSYKLNQICPTLLTQQKALRKSQGRILTLTQQATSMADKIRRLCKHTREGRCLRTPLQLHASLQKAAPNEASQQEESSATTHTSVGAIYRRQSKKIRFGEQ